MSPLILCIYAMPLLQCSIQSDMYGTTKLLAAAFLVFLAAFRNGFAQLRVDRYFVAFGVCAILSTLLSEYPAISALGEYRVYTSALLPGVLVGAMFYLAAGSKDKADSYDNLCKHAIYAACISSVWGILQKGGMYAMFPLPGGRIYSGMGSPVYLAAFLAFVFPLALERKAFKSAGLILVGIFLSGTRAGLIAAVVAGFFLYHGRMGWRVKAGLGAAFLALFIGMSAMRSALIQADTGRLIVYKVAIKAFLDNPLFGHGPDLFTDAFVRYRTQDWLKAGFTVNHVQGTAHNDVLQALATGGILYTGAYLALCWALLGLFRRSGHVGMVASAISLFTFAKLNETAFPVKALFFILAGAAVQRLNKKTSGFKYNMLPLGVVFTFYFGLFATDRLMLWYKALESSRLMNVCLTFMLIYG